jgi:hypothetical protein
MANKVNSSLAVLQRKTAQIEDSLLLSLDVPDPRLRALPRGAMTEITGARSSGRTAFLHSVFATATALGETCAMVDSAGAFDPVSAAANGVDLDRIFWVRCQGRADRAMKAADWIVHAGGFGVVALDLCEMAPEVLGRIPLSWWYRFRNAVENTRTVFLITADRHITGSATARIFGLDGPRPLWSGSALHTLLTGMDLTCASRKPLMAGPVRHKARLAG